MAEVAECAVASGSAARELQQSVDGLDSRRGRVVFEVAQNAVHVPSE